ncbi:MAG TPA: radical SAM family heme chaperone HemW [Vicinamibacterales bacterium]|nr:radical SAM family heme chaperone HemW [Vicinamibacterales bacterium]
MARPEPSGLYLHIPFCASICNYCNFNRGLLDEGLKQSYVSALVREIELRATGEAVDTVYFGGGTPSLLSPDEAARLIAACRAAFDVRPGAEITFEVNPETVDRAKLAAYRDAGINRLSFGVQSFDDAELARLDRRHDAARARAACGDARAAGFDNISLDLMMWLPGQSVAGWLANVEALIAVSPEHASLYLLEVYPNAPLREAMARQQWSVAADDEAAEMYERGMEMLELAGYAQYEISNVARPGHESRHNVKYWTGGAWHGLGAGAHGTVGTRRWRNVADSRAFIAAVAAGALPEAEARVLPDEERLQEALFMGLRMRRGIDIRELGAAYGVDLAARYGERLAPYVTAGLLEPFDGGRLSLTARGRLMANEVLSVFV